MKNKVRYLFADKKTTLPQELYFEQIRIGDSTNPLLLTYDERAALSCYFTCASVNGSTSFEPVLINTVMTGIGQVGGRVRVNMETNVRLGSWANAFKASIDFKTAGGVTGLGSAICAEMTLPGGAAGTGTLGVLELEVVCPLSWTSSQLVSLIYAENSGSTKAKFVTEGYLMNLTGMGTPVDDTVAIFHYVKPSTTVIQTHGLRILVDGVAYDILLAASAYSSN